MVRNTTRDFLKTMFFLGFIVVITACGSSGEDRKSEDLSVMDMNFKGTWRLRKEYKYYSARHNDYLYSYFEESRVYFRHSESNLNTFIVDRCESFTNDSVFAVADRDESGLNIENETATFTYAALNVLQSEHTFLWEFKDEDVNVVEISTLQKESEDFLLDSGSLVLNTPIHLVDDGRVCLTRTYYSNSPAQSFWLATALGAEQVNLGIILYNLPGSNPYRHRDEFWLQRKTVSMYLHAPLHAPHVSNLELTIHQSDDNIFQGEFTFDDQNSLDSFSGEFEALF